MIENLKKSAYSSLDQVRVTSILENQFVRSLPFWLPSALLVAFFVYGAIVWNALISLTDYRSFGSPNFSDLDFEMYRRAFSDPELIGAAVNNAVLLVVFTILSIAVGLSLALLIDRDIRIKGSVRLIFLLPFSLAFIVTGQIWLWIYNYNYGIANAAISAFGFSKIQFIANPQVILGAVIVGLVWQYSGYAMIVFLAGLQSIPDDQYEAAKIDGASTFRMYWRIIIPQLKASAASAVVVLMVFALKTFDFLYAMFGSYRPKKGSDILATKMVREAFQKTEWAYGASIAALLFLLTLGIITPYLYYQYTGGRI